MQETMAFREYLTEDENPGKSILNFINQNKSDLVNLLANKYYWDPSEVKDYIDTRVYLGLNSEGQLDADVAGFDDGEYGFDFSFDASKVQINSDGAKKFTLSLGGVLVYGIVYDVT